MRRVLSTALCVALMLPAPLAGATSPPPAPDAPVPISAVDPARVALEPVGCLVKGRISILEASISHDLKATGARLYFRSAFGEAWYYTSMASDGPGGGVGVRWRGMLPSPSLEVSPVRVFVAVGAGSSRPVRSPEVSLPVVATEADCPAGMTAAHAASDVSNVTVYSAASGTELGIPRCCFGGCGPNWSAIVVATLVAAAAVTGTIMILNDEGHAASITDARRPRARRLDLPARPRWRHR